MPIIYHNQYLRAQAVEHRFILPGDDSMAEQCGFSKRGVHVNFLDNDIAEFVELVGKKGWDIPGIKTTFSVSGKAEMPIHRLYSLEGDMFGDKWKIRFDRKSHYSKKDNHHFHGLPEKIIIPGYEFAIMDDGVIATEKDEDPNHFNPDHAVLDANLFFFSLGESISYLPDVTNDPYDSWKKIGIPLKTPVNNVPTLYTTQMQDVGTNYLSHTEDRLFPVSDMGGNIPDVLYDNCTIAFSNAPYHSKKGWWGNALDDEDYIGYAINLKYSNDVYVVDETPFNACHDFLLSLDKSKEDLTKPQKQEAFSILASTLVSLADYKQDYKNPIYLIYRPLWKDEAIEITQDTLAYINKQHQKTHKPRF